MCDNCCSSKQKSSGVANAIPKPEKLLVDNRPEKAGMNAGQENKLILADQKPDTDLIERREDDEPEIVLEQKDTAALQALPKFTNLVDYRRALFKEFEQAQSAYLERQRRQRPEYENRGRQPVLYQYKSLPQHTTSRDDADNFVTVMPRSPKLSLSVPFKCYKFRFMGNIKTSTLLTRYFLLDDNNFTYYTTQDSVKVKGSTSLLYAQITLQTKEKHDEVLALNKQGRNERSKNEDLLDFGVLPWTESKESARTILKLQSKRTKPILIYSSDLNLLKALTVKVRVASDPDLRAELPVETAKVSQIANVTKFESFWSFLRKLYSLRIKRGGQFQIVGIRLVDVASQNWQRNRRLIKKISDLVQQNQIQTGIKPLQSKALMPIIFGTNHQFSEVRQGIVSSFIVSQKLQTLAIFFKNRKYIRSGTIQDELNFLRRMGEKGFSKVQIEVQLKDSALFKLKDAQVIFPRTKQSNKVSRSSTKSYMLIEQLTKQDKNGKTDHFLAKDFLRRVNLGDVSFISTDASGANGIPKRFQNKGKSEYRIHIYGPCLEKLKTDENGLQSAEQLQFCPMISQNDLIWQIRVQSIQIPTQILRNWENQLTYLRLTLQYCVVQENGSLDQNRRFEVKSRYFVVNKFEMGSYIEALKREKQTIDANISLQFNVKSIFQGQKQRTTLKIDVIQTKQATQEATLQLTEPIMTFESNQDIGCSFGQNENTLSVPIKGYKCSNFASNSQILIDGVVEKPISQKENSLCVHRWEGPRFLVGGLALFDNKNVVRIEQIDYKGNLRIRSMISGDIIAYDTPMKRLKPLERYGVSIYALNEMPKELNQMKYAWKYTLKTSNQHIFTILKEQISEIQLQQSSDQRPNANFYEQYQHQKVGGQIICRVVQAKDLGRSRVLQEDSQIYPYVQIKVQNKTKEDFKGVTSVIKSQKGQNLLKCVIWDETNLSEKENNSVQNIFNLGEFSRNIHLDQTDMNDENCESEIIFEVKSQGYQNEEDIMIGTAKLQINGLLDLAQLQKNKQLVLNLRTTELCDNFVKSTQNSLSGTLIIQTLFIPNMSTRTFQIDQIGVKNQILSSNLSEDPKAILRLNLLSKASSYDKFHFKIPMPIYETSRHIVLKQKLLSEKQLDQEMLEAIIRPYGENVSLPNILQKESGASFEDIINNIAGLNLNLDQAQTLKQQNKILAQLSIKFNSFEEVRDLIGWLQSQKRPIRTEIVVNMYKIMLAQNQQITSESRQKIVRCLWQVYLTELTGGEVSFNEDATFDLGETMVTSQSMDQSSFIDLNNSVIEKQIRKIHRKRETVTNKRRNVNEMPSINNSPSNGQNQNFSMIRFKSKSNLFIFSNLWEKNDDQKFADLYYLVHAGIPNELRSRIWQELLKTPVIEKMDRKRFMGAFGIPLDPSMSLYENYSTIARQSDCLSFKQIDEDVGRFVFAEDYLGDLSIEERLAEMRCEKIQIRNVLRCLILWSRKLEIDGQIATITYGSGFMHVVQRMLLVTNGDQEGAFWILAGLIRSFPRPFAVKNSILLDEQADSIMRYEMVAFKAALQHNSPSIFEKLKAYGLPIETLVYSAIFSFYSTFFTSEIVLRLWDIIIFHFSTRDKLERKRALWWILTPSLYIFEKAESQILEAQSTQAIINAFQSGKALTYDPDFFIQEIRQKIKVVFVEGQKIVKNQWTYFFKTESVQNLNAFDFEKKRELYSGKIKEMVSATQIENLAIQTMIDKATAREKEVPNRDDIFQRKDKDIACALNSDSLAQDVLQGVKNVSIRGRQVQELTQIQQNSLAFRDENNFSQEDLKLANLGVKQVHIFLHSLSKVPQEVNSFKIKLTYGQICQKTFVYREDQLGKQMGQFDGQSVSLQEFDHTSACINSFSSFNYKNWFNHLRIQLFDAADGQPINDTFVQLQEVPLDQFVTRTFVLRDPKMLNIENSYHANFSHIKVTFFLESKHIGRQIETENSLFSSLQTLQKKIPDRVDIFNKREQEKMAQAFEVLVARDFSHLNEFLPSATTYDIINNSYNYVDFGGISDVSQDAFFEFVNTILPASFQESQERNSAMELVYQVLQGRDTAHQKGLENNFLELVSSTSLKTLNANVSSSQPDLTGRLSARSSIGFRKNMLLKSERQESRNEASMRNFQQGFIPFSLRSFLCSAIMMSHATVLEKIETLFDIFDFVDGTADGNTPQDIFELIQTIFQRNLYIMPNHELYNLVENVFTGGVSMVCQASLSSLSANKESVFSIDVTKEVQIAFQDYFAVFGSKIIDFNPDASPFQNLEDLIGDQNLKVVLNAFKSLPKSAQIKIELISLVHGERMRFSVIYDPISLQLVASDQISQNMKNGNLMDTTDSNPMISYCRRISNRLVLQGISKFISKEEFLGKLEQIPLFTNMIRAETFFRDQDVTLTSKNPIDVPLFVTIATENLLFIFNFSNSLIEFVEGTKIEQRGRSIQIEMQGVTYEDTWSEIRQRIILALREASSRSTHIHNEIIEPNQSKNSQNCNHISNESGLPTNLPANEIYGERSFYMLTHDVNSESQQQSQPSPHWEQLREDHVRLSKSILAGKAFTAKESYVHLKMERSSLSVENEANSDDDESNFECQKASSLHQKKSQYDCFSLYRHSDGSYEWRPCRVVKIQNLGQKSLASLTTQGTFWIEFEHLVEHGNSMWLKRSSEQILFGAEYRRQNYANFDQDNLNFVKMLFK